MANDHEAAKNRPTKGRFGRILMCLIWALLPTLSFCFLAMVLFRDQWLMEGTYDSEFPALSATRPVEWTEFHPWRQFCFCRSPQQTYCEERNEYFRGSSYLSLTILAVQGSILFTLLIELAAFGPHGSSHNVTYLVLMLQLVVIATHVLSLLIFGLGFDDKHCNGDSFKEAGASIGWLPYYRGGEVLLNALMIILNVNTSKRGGTRGPPINQLLGRCILFFASTVSTFGGGWIVVKEEYNGKDRSINYGQWNACVCYHPPGCNTADYNTQLFISLILSVAQTVGAFLTLAFVVLRAVDSVGVTLKYSAGFAVFTVCTIIGNAVNVLISKPKVECEATAEVVTRGFIPAPVEYSLHSSTEFIFYAGVCEVLFIAMTLVFTKRANTASVTPLSASVESDKEGGLDDGGVNNEEAEDPEVASQGSKQSSESAPPYPRLLHHTLWWDYLVSPPVLGRMQREDEEVEAERRDEAEDEALMNSAEAEGGASDVEMEDGEGGTRGTSRGTARTVTPRQVHVSPQSTPPPDSTIEP